MKAIVLTEEEKQFINQYHRDMTSNELSKAIGYSRNVVVKYLLANQLQARSSQWDEKSLLQLKELAAEGCTRKQIAKVLNRSHGSIQNKLHRKKIKLNTKKMRRWTKEEDKKLASLWGKRKLERVAKELNRTTCAIRARACKLKFPTLLEASEIIGVTKFCKIIKISKSKYRKWIAEGFPIELHTVSIKRKYQSIDVTDALNWLELHQEWFDAANIEPYSLVYEPKWLVSKRYEDSRKRLQQSIMQRKPKPRLAIEHSALRERTYWTTKEHNRLVEMCSERKPIAEMAKIFGRSHEAVSARIYVYQIQYLAPSLYTEDEIEFIKNHYQAKTYKWIGAQIGRSEKAVTEYCRRHGMKKCRDRY